MKPLDIAPDSALETPPSGWRLPVIAVILAILVGLAFSYTHNWESQRIQTEFEKTADAYTALISERIHTYWTELDALRRHFRTSSSVTREEFADFVQPVIQRYPEIQGMFWVPRIPRDQRKAWETAPWSTGLGGTFIHDHDMAAGKRFDVVAGEREVYYPVTYIEPLDQDADSVGLDLGHDGQTTALFRRAVEQNEAQIATIENFNPYHIDDVDAFIIEPVQGKTAAQAQSEGTPSGFVLLQFEFETTLQAIISGLRNTGIVIRVIDTQEGQASRVIYEYVPESAGALPDSIPAYSVPLLLLGHHWPLHWNLEFTPTADYLQQQHHWQSWVVLGLGTVLGLLLLAYLRIAQHQTVRIQLLVDKRTAALRASQLQQRTILDVAGDAIVTIDKQGVILSFNHAAEKMFGYRAAEIIGTNVSRLLPEHERTAHEYYTAHSRLHEQRVINRTRDLYGLRRNGEEFPLELNVAPVDLETGRGFVGVLRDITERKRAQELLLAEKERLSEILRNTLDGYLQIDRDWIVGYVNPSAEQLLDITADEVVGLDLRETLPDVVSMFYKVMRSTLQNSEQGETIALYGPTMKYLEAHTSPTRDGLIVYFRDITARRHAEAELVKTKEMAERASQAKSGYLSRISHELRTPMNAIMGFGQLLEMDPALDQSQRGNVEEILKASGHLLELINEVLDIARIESGRHEFHMALLDLPRLVNESLAMIREKAEKEGVRIRNEISGDCSRQLYADAKAMKQILINLLSNAVKYNRPNGLVTIFCEAVPGDKIRISVRDTGDGIESDKFHLLFEPFERLGREAEVEGTGVGLTVVKTLVQGMNGQVGLDSQLNVGTTFWVEFPTRPSA